MLTAEMKTRQVNRIVEWMQTILSPGQIVEVRALHPFASRTFATAEEGAMESLARFAAEWSGRSKGVYFTPNPLKSVVGSGKHGTTLDDDVEARHWLLIDADPKRPKNSNATTEERVKALELIQSIRDCLTFHGAAGMVLGDSGNGAHLMVPVDLPNDSASRTMHRQLLRYAEERFGTQYVEVDASTFNAARIWKMPGTLAMKGPEDGDRQHRYARLLDVPESPRRFAQSNVVALGKCLDHWRVTSWLDPEAEETAGKATGDRAALVKRAIAYVAKEPPAVDGKKGSKRCFHVAGICHDDFALEEEECLEAMHDWNQRCTPPWSEKELRHKIDSIRKKCGPRGRLANQNQDRGERKTVNGAPVTSSSDGPLIVRASTIVPRKVEWLWPGRIPIGKMTTFAGVGGLGKTFVLCDISARVSRGLDWPDSAGECCEAGQVLFISGEDDPEDTLVPRLIQLGADLDRVAFLHADAESHFTLKAVEVLSAAVEQIGPDTRLVVIDPPTGYLGDVNDHKNSELRRLLTPLKRWAAERRVALVFNTHVNKPQGTKVDAMMRVMGSVAWVNAVRAAHMFARDPEDPERRLFVGMKMNMAKERKGLAYRIVALPDDQATVEWLGEVDTTADEAVNRDPPVKKKRKVEATEWLEEIFATTNELPSKTIYKTAEKDTTLSADVLKETKDTMGIRAEQRYDTDKKRTWWWYWLDIDRARWISKHHHHQENSDAKSF